MKAIRWILLRLLYLTPIGFIIDVILLEVKIKEGGILVNLSSRSPISASVKENPTGIERINWLIDGLFLLLESFFAIKYDIKYEWDFAGVFAFLATIIALVYIVAAIFPRARFNKKL